MKSRCNIYLDEDIKQWCQLQAEVMGMSMSAFITMCVYQYKQSQEGLKAMQNMTLFADQLQQIKKMFDDMRTELRGTKKEKME